MTDEETAPAPVAEGPPSTVDYAEHMEQQLGRLDMLLSGVDEAPASVPVVEAPQGRCVHGEPLTASCDECRTTLNAVTPDSSITEKAERAANKFAKLWHWMNEERRDELTAIITTEFQKSSTIRKEGED